MITSYIDICNLALDYCNVRNITSFEENTKEAQKCLAWYDLVRKSLLTNLNASFAIKRAKLVEISDYEPIFGYKKAYALPKDLLQVLNIGNPLDDILYQIEGNYLYCDSTPEQLCCASTSADASTSAAVYGQSSTSKSPLIGPTSAAVYVRYLADIQDVTQFDSDFAELLALKLAERICISLTEDIEKSNWIKGLAQQKYIECSTKYGNDNKLIVINKPRYRRSKLNAEIPRANYRVR